MATIVTSVTPVGLGVYNLTFNNPIHVTGHLGNEEGILMYSPGEGQWVDVQILTPNGTGVTVLQVQENDGDTDCTQLAFLGPCTTINAGASPPFQFVSPQVPV